MSAIQPGVVCFIVPPTTIGYEHIANKLCTAVEPMQGGMQFADSFVYPLPGQRAWVVELSSPVTVSGGHRMSRVLLYESWLRPINGPDIDISEADAAPARDTTLTPRPQLEHAR